MLATIDQKPPAPPPDRKRLQDLIAPSFHAIFTAVHGVGAPDGHYYVHGKPISELWAKGGRGSTKSSFTALDIVIGMEMDPMANAVIIRKVASTLRGSVYVNIQWALKQLGVESHWLPGVSPMMFTNLKTGQQIRFYGLDDREKMKSIKFLIGYAKILWFEEPTELDGMDEVRSVEQSVLRGGPSYMEYFTYNPPRDPNAWVNKEVDIPKPGRLVHSSTYLDVPKHWLGQKFIDDAEALRQRDPLAYDHEYMGLPVGNTASIILSGHYIVEDFEPQDHWDGPYFGADFGFAEDPATLIKCWVDLDANELNIEYEAWGKGVEINHYDRFYHKIPESDRYKIRADSANPAQISYIKKELGFDIEGVEKWAGSVEDGIAILKSFNVIRIHSRCEHTIEEARLYSYKVDRLTGDVLPDIVDKYNHCWDAVRYALAPFIKKKAKIGFLDV